MQRKRATSRRGSSRSWGDIPGYDPKRDAKGYRFNELEAKTACDFFSEVLKFIEGARAGEPFTLEPWQRAIVGNAFGWLNSKGLRRYREIFVFVPRKNGKTPLAAGLVLLLGFCDGEPGAQIYAAAAEREQAALVFRHAAGMVVRSEDLESRSRIYKSFKAIDLPLNGIFKALSHDADTKHGFNSHAVVIDELHAHKTRDLVDVLLTSTGSRRQPMVVYITTAGYDRNSICYEKYDYACKVRDGVIHDPGFLPVIYEAPADADWKDEKTWKVANPNLGVSVSLDYLRRECKRAQDQPTYENTFRRLHLNQWTEQDIRFLQMDAWDKCNGALRDLAGRPCFAGLDLSTTRDISAFVLLFPWEDGTYDVLPYFWVPGESAKDREDRDRVPYRTWARQGFVALTEGNVVDYDKVRERILELREVYDIREVAIDRWNSTQLQTQLAGEGVTVVPFGQGYASMSAPTKELEKLVVSGRLRHAGNPVLRWMASNVTVEEDAAGNLKPSKAKSTERIDGIVAGIMALGRALVANTVESVYETRGVLRL